jgi:hypothetical protein
VRAKCPHQIGQLFIQSPLIIPSQSTEAWGAVQIREVLRPQSCDAAFITGLQNALRKAGYKCGSDATELNAKIMKALNKYQKENDLAVGLLDFETLRSLGVK